MEPVHMLTNFVFKHRPLEPVYYGLEPRCADDGSRAALQGAHPCLEAHLRQLALLDSLRPDGAEFADALVHFLLRIAVLLAEASRTCILMPCC